MHVIPSAINAAAFQPSVTDRKASDSITIVLVNRYDCIIAFMVPGHYYSWQSLNFLCFKLIEPIYAFHDLK
jgi:hypothetical protein